MPGIHLYQTGFGESQHFAQRFAAALQTNRAEGRGGPPELNDADHLVALLEAASATFDVNDPNAVEGVFTVQAASLDVIFKDFIRRKTFTFDNMRVALRAQAQCRATFRTLSDFKNPRPRATSAAQTKNLNIQTVESAKSSAC